MKAKKFRKMLAAILAVTMVSAGLAGCGSSESSSAKSEAAPAAAESETAEDEAEAPAAESAASEAEAETADESTAEAASDDEVYTLKCAYELADDHVWAVQFQAMAEELKEKSNGRLILELYGNSQLGAESELITQLMQGSLDMMPTSANNISAAYPPCLVLTAPYGIKNLDEANIVYESDWGKQKLQEIEDNTKFHGLSVLYGGVRHCFTTDKVVNSIDDLKGMKMRVPEWEMYVTMFSEWGASPTTMDFSEVYLALQQGVVDGFENPIDFFMAANMFEVTKTMVKTYHQAEVSMLWINSDKYNSLPEDLRNLLDETSDKYCAIASENVEKNEEQKIQSLIDDYGFTVTEPDLAPFQEAALTAIHKFDDEWGATAYDEMLEVIAVGK